MTQERMRRAEIGGLEAAAANPDEQLARRLEELNDSTWPLELRLEPREVAALLQCYFEITDQHPVFSAKGEVLAHILGMCYGFGLGHDYALRYGRLGKEPEVSP